MQDLMSVALPFQRQIVEQRRQQLRAPLRDFNTDIGCGRALQYHFELLMNYQLSSELAPGLDIKFPQQRQHDL
jgi:hypothetical protein